MLTTDDCDSLVVVIDLNTCLTTNDAALAESVRDTLNNMEQGDYLVSAVNDAVADGMLANRCPKNADAYRIIIEGCDCVKAKPYKLAVLETMTILSNKDQAEMNAWLDGKGFETFDPTAEENQRVYASLLIRMCIIAKRYDVMDKIRSKLKGEG